MSNALEAYFVHGKNSMCYNVIRTTGGSVAWTPTPFSAAPTYRKMDLHKGVAARENAALLQKNLKVIESAWLSAVGVAVL